METNLRQPELLDQLFHTGLSLHTGFQFQQNASLFSTKKEFGGQGVQVTFNTWDFHFCDGGYIFVAKFSTILGRRPLVIRTS